MNRIDKFEGDYFFLSNFSESPIKFNDGITYPTVEHLFQAQKTMDMDMRRKIANAATPGQAKRLGRSVLLRKDWEEIKNGIMFDAVYQKFKQNSSLKEKLLSTGDAELIEGNWWNDTYWGVCRGLGRNQLGITLMEVRDIVKN